MTVKRATRVEDGFEITDTFEDGVLMGTAIVSVEEKERAVELEKHRGVLLKQLDPESADPSRKELADAQAFLALSSSGGV